MSLSKPDTSLWICMPARFVEETARSVLSNHTGDKEAARFYCYANSRMKKYRKNSLPRMTQEEFDL